MSLMNHQAEETELLAPPMGSLLPVVAEFAGVKRSRFRQSAARPILQGALATSALIRNGPERFCGSAGALGHAQSHGLVALASPPSRLAAKVR